MTVSGPPRRSPWVFVGLTFVLSVPFWAIGALSGRQLTADLPVSSFIWVCPGIAAALLVYREDGGAGVRALLRRAFDWTRIPPPGWLVAIVLLPPGVYTLTYVVMRAQGLPLPVVQFSLLAALGWFLGFFVAGEAEELGWSGYALDPLQARWGALGAGLLLGLIWVVFHAVPLVQHGRAPVWIAWWALSTVAFRVLVVWIYNNTGQSVFAAALFHALTNLSWIGPFLDFGPAGYPLAAQRISALILAGIAAIVVVAWGPRTLARFRLG
jgi:membrane protease YdiL (CAAX protease family)